MANQVFANPFRPGAGQMPPYLAGRNKEKNEFRRLLGQATILENMVLTGLRGTGKTVLLDTFKPMAMEAGWRWATADLSESASVDETTLAVRLLTDLAPVTADVVAAEVEEMVGFGFGAKPAQRQHRMGFDALLELYETTPGLVADKLKRVLETAWGALRQRNVRGVVFAYDEAQTMSDHPAKSQYPLSVLLDIFQSIQKKGIPFMLVLTGLPTLFPKLVEARTFAERMFHVVFLDRLNESDSRDAICKPFDSAESLGPPNEDSIELVVQASGGYPYFIQFICREVYDVFLQKLGVGEEPSVPIAEITRKLDADFFAGRWARATDRQRELLSVIATLDTCDEEFTVQEVVERSKERLDKPFSASHANQMLAALSNAGLIFKNRHGKYSFAVPLLGQYILRTTRE